MNRNKIINILKNRGIIAAVVFITSTSTGTYVGTVLNQQKNDAIIAELNDELSRKKSSIEQLKNDIQDLKMNVVSLQQENTDLITSNDNFKKQLEELNKTYESVKAENVQLKEINDIKNSGISVSRGASAELASNMQRVLIEYSAYCPTDEGVGEITANGSRVQVGHVAAPAEIPFGTNVIIEGFSETFTVTDRGGYIQKVYNENGEPVYRIDIFVNSHAEAVQIGRHTVYGYFIYNN